LRAHLGDLISVPGETRWLGHLNSMKNILINSEKITKALDNDLFAAAALKPVFNRILERKSTIEAMVNVLEVIKKPLVKLQVVV
jgi:F0F1-type ATP synthase delta subunit